MHTDFTKVIRVILADDHQGILKGIHSFFSEDSTIEVVAEADNGTEAIRLIQQHEPDIVLLDIHMPGQNGLEVAQWIHKQSLLVAVIILTIDDQEICIRTALNAGVRGYLLKTIDPHELIQAVHAVYRGGTVFDPSVTQFLSRRQVKSTTESTIAQLSGRERTILRELARGGTNSAIGIRLGISDRTVQNHLTNINRKLDVINRTEAVMKAIQLGLID